MGYYSDFYIDKTDIPYIEDVLSDITGYWPEGQDYSTEIKWYNWLTDLEKVAKLFPEGYLRIVRYGEESPDISAAVVTDSKVYEVRPTIVWPI